MTDPHHVTGWPATPGQWLDALLGVPAQLNRIIQQNERLIVMAGESQVALAELGASISAEMDEFASRQEAHEAQVRELLDRLGATQQQVDSLDLTIAADIRAASARVRDIVPAATGGGGTDPQPVQAAAPTGDTDPTDADTDASPVGQATDGNADTAQGDTGGPPPDTAGGPQVDDRSEYTIPRTADDGTDEGEADRPFTYDSGQASPR